MSNQSDLAKSAAGFNGDPLSIDTANNRVGIGTSSPSESLTNRGNIFIETNSTSADSGNGLFWQSTTAGWNTSSAHAAIYGKRTDASNGYLRFDTRQSGTTQEAMRIDSSGNLQLTSVDQDIEFNATTTAHESRLKWNYGGTLQSWIEREHSDGSMVFGNQGSERMRITSSGELVNTGSTLPSASVQGFGVQDQTIHTSATSTSTRNHHIFYNGNGAVGSIKTSGSSTSYNTSSDHRLKENVIDVTDGITRVKQLEPKRFNFIADPDTTVDGFLAHQAQAVVPEAVTGTHNEVDDDGNAVMQGIDQSKLVPLLTAALKEAITKIETLETEMTSVKARLDALEGN